MGHTIARRLVDAIPTLLLVLTLVFVAMRVLPGDPALAVLGEHATAQQLAEFRRKIGLDLPLWQQYVNFIISAATFSFGNSFANNFSVGQLVRLNLPYTVELTIAATIIGVLIAVPVGVASAVNRGRPIELDVTDILAHRLCGAGLFPGCGAADRIRPEPGMVSNQWRG